MNSANGFTHSVLATNFTTEFDGHTFGSDVFQQRLYYIDLAYRARRGDAHSKMLLEAAKITIRDVKGEIYYHYAQVADGGKIE